MKYHFQNPEDQQSISALRLGKEFTNPFRYIPQDLVKKAAGEIIAKLESWKSENEGSPLRELEKSFAEGKMLGVLVVSENSSNHFIAAFSGTVRGADGLVTGSVEGFVPPIIDLTDPNGFFKKEEAAISELNARISSLSSSPQLTDMRQALKDAQSSREREIAQMQENIRRAKSRREGLRQTTSDPQIADELIRESQFQKAELKRLKDRWRNIIEGLSSEVKKAEDEISELKTRRARMSDALQKWIFENTLVHNGLGQSASIWEIFDNAGLIPPGGTGDCAAPKLLEYAFRHDMKPLAMGEFWYGRSPETAVRTHGHFYPSCTSKCGPLLGYMMQGLEHPSGSKRPQQSSPISEQTAILQESGSSDKTPIIIYEDEAIIVAEKPSGMPSVPGLDGRKSLQEWLCEHCAAQTAGAQSCSETQPQSIHAVHRLDMDTSGVMIFAKDHEAAVNLRRQFEEHTIRKTYMARVSPTPWPHLNPSIPTKNAPQKFGSIDLPLSPDYDERPRQKVDFKQGKEAHTEFEIVKEYADGTADLLLYPHTGRTHQLRVHCAHTLGLGRPILGDLLYGAHTVRHKSGAHSVRHKSHQSETSSESTQMHPSRLCLHAHSITFRHPVTGSPLTFTASSLCY